MSYVYRDVSAGAFLLFLRDRSVERKRKGGGCAYLDISSCPTLISLRGISPLVASSRTRNFFDEIRSRLLDRKRNRKKEEGKGRGREGENEGSLLAFFRLTLGASRRTFLTR